MKANGKSIKTLAKPLKNFLTVSATVYLREKKGLQNNEGKTIEFMRKKKRQVNSIGNPSKGILQEIRKIVV